MSDDAAMKTAIVTGATSGLGQAAAIALAKAGYHVVLVGRDAARGRETLSELEKAGTGELELADLFSLKDVAALGERLAKKHPSIDLLVNNAGGTFSKTEKTVDGLERTFALNVAAPFVLTEALRPSLARAKGRVVNLVTGVPSSARATLEQLNGAKAAAGMGSYVRAKLALLAVTLEQQARYGKEGITFTALHPGIIPGTRFGPEMPALMKKWGPVFARIFRFGTSLEEAANRYVAIGTGPVEAGGFYYEGKLRAAPVHATRAEFRGPLWKELEGIAAKA
jgi:NAD(P)-dependent dehydrogenase (short-subunit alcohol dehydrogenase family)